MAFNIEQMKADGVSSHLIELASMSQETFLLLIARRLEHDKIFQQFMGQNAGSVEAMYPYAVAAGLMSEYDRLWLIDEDNPYKEGGGAEVWLVGDTGESGMFTLSNVGDIDRMAELFTNGENYQVFANSEALPYYTAPTMGGSATWQDNATEEASTIILAVEQLENDEYSAVLYYSDASTAPTSVEVSVKAK